MKIRMEMGVYNTITIPIKNETAAVSNKVLLKIARQNNFKAETAKNFEEALRKISSREAKVCVFFGSLYILGQIINKN